MDSVNFNSRLRANYLIMAFGLVSSLVVAASDYAAGTTDRLLLVFGVLAILSFIDMTLTRYWYYR